MEGEGVDVMVETLFPISTVITPNVPEAEVLASLEIKGEEDMLRAARKVLDLGPKAVLVKGGHLKGDVYDVLVVRKPDGERVYRFRAERLKYDVHGTGCVLSSSIAALLALGYDVITAVSMAITDMRNALKERAVRVGKGRRVLF